MIFYGFCNAVKFKLPDPGKWSIFWIGKKETNLNMIAKIAKMSF